jgi:hypothetical protein
MVMDFVNGGTLYFWMRKMGTLVEEQAWFYAAELLLALEHLHAHSIVHRGVPGVRAGAGGGRMRRGAGEQRGLHGADVRDKHGQHGGVGMAAWGGRGGGDA